MFNDASDDDLNLDLQLKPAEQLHILTNEYARLWRVQANLDRIYDIERLLERLLTVHKPVEIPPWLIPGSDGPLPKLGLIVRTLRELQTCRTLIDPALEAHGWTPAHIRREEHFRDKRDNTSKRIDYALRIPCGNGRLKLVALLEAKHEGFSPIRGLEQVKRYAAGRRERIRFVFSTNGHHFVQYDRHTKEQGDPQLLDFFPTPEQLANS